MTRTLLTCVFVLLCSSALADEPDIRWNRPAKPLQLGYAVEPDRDCYAIGEVLKVRLFVRNAGTETIEFATPRLEVLEKLGFDVELRDRHGRKLPWEWGPAHHDEGELTVSGAISESLAAGGTKELPPVYLLLGRDEKPDNADSIHAKLGVKIDAGARLYFRISSIGIARGDEAHLETEALEFDVVRKK